MTILDHEQLKCLYRLRDCPDRATIHCVKSTSVTERNLLAGCQQLTAQT